MKDYNITTDDAKSAHEQWKAAYRNFVMPKNADVPSVLTFISLIVAQYNFDEEEIKTMSKHLAEAATDARELLLSFKKGDIANV